MGSAISAERPWRRSRIAVPVASPAAGADWSLTVQAGHVFRLVAVRALFTASGAVANRVPVLTLGEESVALVHIPVAANITAGQAITLCWALGTTALAFGTTQALPLPGIDLEPASTISTVTAAIDAADQWSAIRLWVIDTTVRGGDVDLADLPAFVVEIAAGAPG